jgi:hypothetical protein
VRIVHVGTIELDHISRSGEKTSAMMSTMWNSLSTLPSHSRSLEEVLLIFRPDSKTFEENAAELERFAWLDLVGKLQELFPSLKTITLGVGYYVSDNEDPVPYLAALRRAPGLRQLEEKGTVLLHMIPWQSYGLVRPFFQH